MKIILKGIGLFIRICRPVQKILSGGGRSSFRIIYYHLVSEESPSYYFREKNLKLDAFRDQLIHLKKYYRFISLEEALEKAGRHESLKGCIAFTSDDGFVQNHSLIAPVLLDLDIPATFFLLNDCIDNKNLMWRNKLVYVINSIGRKATDELMWNLVRTEALERPLRREDLISWSKRVFSMEDKERLTDWIWKQSGVGSVEEFLKMEKPYLSVGQIKELISKGFTIGAHSNSHPLCSKMTYEDLESEVIGSMDGISQKTGYKVELFSYPFGVRAGPEAEKKLISTHGSRIRGLLGIYNTLNNKDPLNWERDMMETQRDLAYFRFYLLPHIRRRGIR